MQRNPQGFILSTKCLCVLFVFLCLLPESTLIKMLESMDLLGVSTQHLNRQVNRVMTRLLAAEGMSHNDFQKRALFSVTTPQNA